MRSKRARPVVMPLAVMTGGRVARSRASVSSMSEARLAPGRYHSSMVNSGACRRLPSSLRQTRASWKDRAGAACQQALHGEFRAGMQPHPVAGAGGGGELGREGFQMDFLARRRDGVGGFDFGVAARGEEAAGGGGEKRAAAQEGEAVGQCVGVPGRCGHGGL